MQVVWRPLFEKHWLRRQESGQSCPLPNTYWLPSMSKSWENQGNFWGELDRAWSWRVGKIQRSRGKYHSQRVSTLSKWESKCRETRIVSCSQLVSNKWPLQPRLLSLPLSHYALATVAFLVFLKHDKCCPASGPLHLLCPLLELHSFPSFSLVPASSSFSGLSSNVASSERPLLVYPSYSHFLSSYQ